MAPSRGRQVELVHRPLVEENRVEFRHIFPEERAVGSEVTVGHGTSVLYERVLAAAEAVLLAPVGLVPVEDVPGRLSGVVWGRFICEFELYSSDDSEANTSEANTNYGLVEYACTHFNNVKE